MGSMDLLSSRAVRKPWRRNGDGPWSSASQAVASTSAMDPTARTSITMLEATHGDRCPAQAEARPDRYERRRRLVHEGKPELSAVRVLRLGREHPQHLDPQVHHGQRACLL